VSQAGRKNAVTVSTNMAGRGTDILLGGNPEFMTKDECLKKKVAERLNEEDAQFIADEHFYYFTHNEAVLPGAPRCVGTRSTRQQGVHRSGA